MTHIFSINSTFFLFIGYYYWLFYEENIILLLLLAKTCKVLSWRSGRALCYSRKVPGSDPRGGISPGLPSLPQLGTRGFFKFFGEVKAGLGVMTDHLTPFLRRSRNCAPLHAQQAIVLQWTPKAFHLLFFIV